MDWYARIGMKGWWWCVLMWRNFGLNQQELIMMQFSV